MGGASAPPHTPPPEITASASEDSGTLTWFISSQRERTLRPRLNNCSQQNNHQEHGRQMLSKSLALSFTVALAAAAACAQESPQPRAAGSVQGHVLCADTQRPARLAEIKLVKVPTADAKGEVKTANFSDAAPSGNSVETSLDGSYTLANVAPGDYYLVVDKPGYLIPLGGFSAKELATPGKDMQERFAKAAVHTITVRSSQATVEDVVLERGASVSGTVLYDDGSPASNIAIKILTRDAKGKWVPVDNGRYRGLPAYVGTDDDGHYRITGLPAGEYTTEADLTLADHNFSSGPMPNNPGGTIEIRMDRTRFSLPLYSGDVLRKPEAKSYTLGSGEARAGSDLVFPLAKLHKVGGQILAKDGHPLNGGKITLLYPDDNSEMTDASIQEEARIFELEFVPEGDFTLKVSAAADVTQIQVPNAPGYTPRFHEETKTLKTYGDIEQPLTVKGDTSDIVVTMPAK